MKPTSDQEMYRKLGGLESWLGMELAHESAALVASVKKKLKRKTGLIPLDEITPYHHTASHGNLSLEWLRTHLLNDLDAPQFAEFVEEVEARLKELGEES